MLRNIAILITILLTNGCVTRGYFDSYEKKKSEPKDVHIIVSDMVDTLKEKYYPAKTTFVLKRTSNWQQRKKEVFGNVLENTLRSEGYAVSSDDDNKTGLKFAYIFDAIDEKTFVVRIVVGESYQVNRIYRRRADGKLGPGSAVAIRSLGG